MVNSTEASQPARLEDVIELAKKGKQVQMEIELRKQPVTQKVHPQQTAEMKDEIETYLLIGDYTFKVEGKISKVSKVYMYAAVEGSANSVQVNRNIVNMRLQVDYGRLKAANITIEEKYF